MKDNRDYGCSGNQFVVLIVTFAIGSAFAIYKVVDVLITKGFVLP